MRVWEFFTHKEGISTPRARHKRRQPLIECAKHGFKIMYFPFFMFIVFSLFMFFTFLGSTRVFPRSYVSSGVMRNSDLRKFESLCVKLFLCFFEKLILITNKIRLRRWTLKQCFKLEKRRESFKALDLEMIF